MHYEFNVQTRKHNGSWRDAHTKPFSSLADALSYASSYVISQSDLYPEARVMKRPKQDWEQVFHCIGSG